MPAVKKNKEREKSHSAYDPSLFTRYMCVHFGLWMDCVKTGSIDCVQLCSIVHVHVCIQLLGVLCVSAPVL